MQNPEEEKFRKIKVDNAAFQSRVATLPSSVRFLEVAGFQEEGAMLFLSDSQLKMEYIHAAGECLQNALTNPMFGIL